jgi:hypothetical protein
MQKRHDEQITAKLEEIITHGAVFINWAEIRKWYGIQRVAAATYRDIAQRWQELTHGKYGDIVCAPAKHSWPENYGFWAFSNKSLKNISELESGLKEDL